MGYNEMEMRRLSVRSSFTNLYVDMPWPKEIDFLLRNNWIKIRNSQNCCGHPGELGC
jgi:hypothetical protein